VAVVATEAGADGLTDGEERALARASDPDSMALAIETLAHDPDERDRLIEAGRRTLARHHEPAAIGARWIDLYRYAAS
jgi:glycosyltransferase involved in cell wall biosynthesis